MSLLESVYSWQADLEVDSCFLCGSKYSLFNRRHHCRKCGRVVCGKCSEQTVKYFPNTMVLSPDNTRHRFKSSEVYKTCDECVNEIRMIRRALFEEGALATRGAATGSEAGGSADIVNQISNSSDQVFSDNDSLMKYSSRVRTRLMRSSTQTSGADGSRQGPDDASDNNLCPVCANDLVELYDESKKSSGVIQENFEAFKEFHINDCLTRYDFEHDHMRFSPSKDGKIVTRNKMLVYNIPPIPKPKYETIPNFEGNSYTINQRLSGMNNHIIDDGVYGSANSQSTIHPVNEKDATNEVDNECVICLEDLKPGDKVGRLECLCVFHYKCIKDWFNKKGYGECPIHFLHK